MGRGEIQNITEYITSGFLNFGTIVILDLVIFLGVVVLSSVL